MINAAAYNGETTGVCGARDEDEVGSGEYEPSNWKTVGRRSQAFTKKFNSFLRLLGKIKFEI